jgi:hypothetical protein
LQSAVFYASAARPNGSLCRNFSAGKCVTPGGIADTKLEVVPTMQPGSGTTKEDIMHNRQKTATPDVDENPYRCRRR